MQNTAIMLNVARSICSIALFLLSSVATVYGADVGSGTLIIHVETKRNRVDYSIPNDLAKSTEFQNLSLERKINFLEIRQRYLTALATFMTKKSVSWLASRPEWVKNLRSIFDDGYGKGLKKIFTGKTQPQSIEDTAAYRWQTQQMLGGLWPANSIKINEKKALENYLKLFDTFLWNDCSNISEYTDLGFLIILEAQSGFAISKYGFYFGTGIAIDIVNDEKAGETRFTLNLFNEKQDREPVANLAFAPHILNLKLAAGLQNKQGEDSKSAVKSGKGWYLPAVPVYALYAGDRLATLGQSGLDIGTMSLTAAVGYGWMAHIPHYVPALAPILAGVTAAWGYILPAWLIRKIAPPLNVMQAVTSIQTRWRSRRLLSFKVKTLEFLKNWPPQKEEIKQKQLSQKTSLICLGLNDL